MKVLQFVTFGNSDVLQPKEVEKPTVKENEILVKIAATTINPLDMKIRSGFMQNAMPITFPFTPGLDFSGIVESVGENVNRLKIGDKVFSTTFGGTYAEYIVVNENQATEIPKNVSYEESAALAIPLTTAYSILVESGKLEKGQKVLIHGAAGGVGTILTQMAKALGAYVIGTASGEGLGLIKSLGADEVIDYKNQDFTDVVKDMDIVIDLVGGETQIKSFSVIKKGGKLLSTVIPPSKELAEENSIDAQFIFSNPSFEKLEFGKKMVENGDIKTQIAKIMKLEDAAEAQDLVSSGGINGKIVLTVN